MCSAPKPPPPQEHKERALARMPKRIVAPQIPTQTAGSTRSTVVNPNPDMIQRAMTADLAATGVVLGA